MINTHQAHNVFLALKFVLFFEIFLQIPLDSQRDIDRKIELFSNPKLSAYYMCHTCKNQFYDSDSFIDWCCLKKLNFESIHIRHINFFEFWKKKKIEIFLKNGWIYNGILIEKWNFFKIQNWAYITCATCAQINFMTLKALLSDIVSKNSILSRYTSGTSIFLNFEKIWFFDQYPVVNPAEFEGKFHFFFFFSKFKKIVVPDVYRLKT